MPYFRMSAFSQFIFKVFVYVSLFWTVFAEDLPQATLTTDSLETGQSACPGENITFNCIVNITQTLAWGSDEYIGTDGYQLTFTFHNKRGDKKYSPLNPDTFAVLIDVTNNGNQSYLLESELYVIMDMFTTISCSTHESQANDSVQINILKDDPGMPQDAGAVQIPSAPDQCVILIDWHPPNNINSPNIDHYIIQSSNKSEIGTVNETSTLATFLFPCEDLNNLFINITAVDRCEHMGASTANFRPTLVVTNSFTHNQVSTTIATTASYSGPDLERIVMITTFSSAAAILAIISSVVLVAIIYCVHRICVKCKNRKFTNLEDGGQANSSQQQQTTQTEAEGETEQSPLNNKRTGSSPTDYGATSSSESAQV